MHVDAFVIFALAAVAVVVVVQWISDHTSLPAAALLTIIGIVYALLPGPNITLDPSFVLTVIIPPLLYSAALDSSLIAIRRNLRPVISLSVALVFATALLVGVGFDLFVAGATLAAGTALGAAVAPPDPVAALAVGRRAGLPGRITTLIQGEGLLNDATALTTLTVAVAAATGGRFSLGNATLQFLLAAVGGVAVGVVVAIFVRLLRPITGDPLTANAVSLATPFLAYLVGEELHVSGVLAVVVAGLIVGHDAPRVVSGASRLQTASVWRLVDFLLEGFVFLLIGQQLPAVVRGLKAYETSTIVIAVVVSVGVVLVLRPLWLTVTQALPSVLHTRLGGSGRGDGGRLTWRDITVLSWSGTRGVISLAAIFTLPLTTDAGDPFPDRDLLLFCAFCVVLVTLVGQGMTFGPLVRRLGVRANAADQARVRNEARVASVQAALSRLDEIAEDEHLSDRAVDTMRQYLDHRVDRYQQRLDALSTSTSGEVPESPAYEAAVSARRALIDAQRDELLRWRDSGRLPDEGLRVLERELDLEERTLPER